MVYSASSTVMAVGRGKLRGPSTGIEEGEELGRVERRVAAVVGVFVIGLPLLGLHCERRGGTNGRSSKG